MGSIPSPPAQSPENSLSGHLVYASFCLREPVPNISTSNWIECYNPSNNTWARVSSIPGLPDNHVLKEFAMVSVMGSIYLIGGRLCRKERTQVDLNSHDEFLEVDVEVLSSVLRYDVKSDQWSRCAPLNVPRYDFASSVCDNKIYVAGGQSTPASARGISSAEVYDPLADEWTPLPNMSTLRYKCVGVTWRGKIHVVGGFAGGGDMDRVVQYVDRSSAEVYDAESGKWDLVRGMWQLDVPPNQIMEVGGKLFSSGDCLNAWKGHIEMYDGKLNIWYVVEGSQRKILPSPAVPRLYLTTAPIGSDLYFLAGYRSAGESSRTVSMVYKFDTAASGDNWRSFEPIEEEGERELCSHCCVVKVN